MIDCKLKFFAPAVIAASRAPSRTEDGSALISLGSKLLKNHSIKDGPFFTNLANGEMALAEFRHTQEQFYFAVNYYSQPIAALFSRISDARLRMMLLGNLMDEHGNINLERCHSTTFKRFLVAIGSDAEIEEIAEEPAVTAFNLALMGACSQEKQDFAAACLGIIELAFSDISATIAGNVIDRGWVAPDAMAHYSLHAGLDIEHAKALFDVAERTENSSIESIERGMRLGIYIFDQLYKGLYLYKCN